MIIELFYACMSARSPHAATSPRDWEKRQILWLGADARAQRRKMISFASGVLALISGGSAAALLAPTANFLEVKVLSAALAKALIGPWLRDGIRWKSPDLTLSGLMHG